MSIAVNLMNGISEGALRNSAVTDQEKMTPAGNDPRFPGTPFGELIASTVGEMNHLESRASAAVEGLITGSGVDVHQAMIATQKADMAFEFALSVRNKAVQAYQQIMQMQF